MPKADNPVTLSGYFGLDSDQLSGLGVLDVTLAIDTKLFIDPLLLSKSVHDEISVKGKQEYSDHFETVIKLLVASQKKGDPAWKAAGRLLKFPEIKGTCLGYGAGSIHGSGFGTKLTIRLLNVADQIVELGIRDPDIFPAMALFESNIGSDRISDMTTNIIMDALISFNKRIIGELGVKAKFLNSNQFKGNFLVNPYESKQTPIILVPSDILRKLPIAYDWDSVSDAASKNEELRNKVNEHIGHIWAVKSKRSKQALKEQVLGSKEAFETLLKAINIVPHGHYDSVTDPDMLFKWATFGREFAIRFPLDLLGKKIDDLNDAFPVVKDIIDKFKHLIEHNGLNKELYKSPGNPRHESTAQRLFFAVAYSYCEANNLDISPEIDTGNGKIDFKFSKGFSERVLVEIKLSTNPQAVSGYETQLEVYRAAEKTMKAVFLVIDVGGMGKKDERLIKLRNKARSEGHPLSELVFIDGAVKPSASKRR